MLPRRDPSLAVIPRGAEVLIEIEVTNGRGGRDFDNPAVLWPRMDPSAGVELVIYRPDGTVLLNGTAMTRVKLGVYRYVQTIAADAATGVYRFEATALHGLQPQMGQMTGAFRVVTA